ncbi:hypothetical protein DFH06DRAFT_61238 [Mycena polygramma]|nr:hypothetical protein DFH06DRAFT_61238 [Mycena polygramma]
MASAASLARFSVVQTVLRASCHFQASSTHSWHSRPFSGGGGGGGGGGRAVADGALNCGLRDFLLQMSSIPHHRGARGRPLRAIAARQFWASVLNISLRRSFHARPSSRNRQSHYARPADSSPCISASGPHSRLSSFPLPTSSPYSLPPSSALPRSTSIPSLRLFNAPPCPTFTAQSPPPDFTASHHGWEWCRSPCLAAVS